MSLNDEKGRNHENSGIKIKDEPADEGSTSIYIPNFAIKQEPEEEFELELPTDDEAPRSCKKLVIYPKEYEKTAPYMCRTCMKRFSDKRILQQHKATHERTTTCDICKIEVKLSLLNGHIKNNHESRKSFECPTCHAQFKVEVNLQQHVKKHDMKFVYKIEK